MCRWLELEKSGVWLFDWSRSCFMHAAGRRLRRDYVVDCWWQHSHHVCSLSSPLLYMTTPFVKRYHCPHISLLRHRLNIPMQFPVMSWFQFQGGVALLYLIIKMGRYRRFACREFNLSRKSSTRFSTVVSCRVRLDLIHGPPDDSFFLAYVGLIC